MDNYSSDTVGTLLKILLQVLLVVATATATTADQQLQQVRLLPRCDSDRPGLWATHRTLSIPQSFLLFSISERAWVTALCCVYTHVIIVDDDVNVDADESSLVVPSLKTYDGREYTIQSSSSNNGNDNDNTQTSIQVMEKVMQDICGMSMGSSDCYDQSVCVEDAMAIITHNNDDNDNNKNNTTTTTTVYNPTPTDPINSLSPSQSPSSSSLVVEDEPTITITSFQPSSIPTNNFTSSSSSMDSDFGDNDEK
mmetsp:Transcript_24413/g.27895  ORF Transcript_24413/g.27895 Transcript_24413/m.27895 type:complete len:252 (-) Transcript_24413:59-814(-)